MFMHLLLPGVILDDEAQSILGQGQEIKASKPRKEDIVSE